MKQSVLPSGGEDTQLDKIGIIQGRFDQGEMKFRGAGEDYGTGYRAGTVGDRLRPFYETYMKEQGLGVTPNPEGYAAGSSVSLLHRLPEVCRL